ncbi:MAG TPA: hypothetical protein VFO27_14195 [Bryobacteraceae bacterium]|nr:hypothetical protein [Bryobacteraceae bacterium]
MFPFHLFRSFLPLHNPIGFGASDFIELALAAMLVLLALAWRPWIESLGAKLAERTGWCMLLLAALPVALRLLLLPQHPAPTPNTSDDFSYLLVADTLVHFRLANPPHALHPFFETFFVLQAPSYSSIFPIGQGIVLALGRILFGHPWAGVLLSVAALCALCYWMLRAWTTPGWALLGGLLAAMQFGPLNQWMNCYWGGAVSAIAGCLVFGALPRLRAAWRTRDAVLLGLGLGMQLLTRPYEFLLLLASVLLFFLLSVRQRDVLRALGRAVPAVALAALPAILLMLVHNKQVTGSWTTLPYELSRDQYGVPATFTVRPNPVPHRELTADQQRDYEVQVAAHGKDTDTVGRYLERLVYRARFYRFFLLAPLYLALAVFFAALREWRFVWVPLALLIFSLGANFYPYFYPHYIAAATCLFVLMSVTGLDRLSRLRIRGCSAGEEAARLIIFLCVAHFVFWYGAHLVDNPSLIQYESTDFINHGDPQGRTAVQNQLAQSPGKQLVFVRYWPQHEFEQWVHNAAVIDAAPVVWARDLGPAENEKLRRYYPDRTAWLLEPDAKPPRLRPYDAPP